MKLGTDYQQIRYDDRADDRTNLAIAHVPSIYADFSGKTSSLMYNAGFTLQYNRMEVRTAGETTLFDGVYLCPQASLMWMVNPAKGTMLGVMYQCTVNDMPYSVINGYRKYDTPYHYTTGNPALRTPRDQEVTVRLALNSHLSAMLMYGRQSDPIYYAHGVDGEHENVTWSRPENGRYQQLVGGRVEFSFAPAKWWNAKLQAVAMKDKFVSEQETLDGQWSGKFWWNNSFRFNPSFGGTLNGYWETGTHFEHYWWKPVVSLEASLWKTFCQDRLRLSFQSVVLARGRQKRTDGDGYVSYYHNYTKPPCP